MVPWLLWIIGGVAARWLVGLVMRGRGYGLVGDLLLGLFGGVSVSPLSWPVIYFQLPGNSR